jgi:SAM-dependent methyltransferase
MPQPLYDRGDFFAAYSRLERSVRGLDGAAEWPALRALLPPLAGKRVLDLGCGFGWFCRWACAQDAAAVEGVDVSGRMLERARAAPSGPAVVYRNADLENIALLRANYDLVYSSLALHYIENLEGLLRQVRDALVPGGHLVFSVEHPIYTAPARPGWSSDAEGRKAWPVDGYLSEGRRVTDWLAPGVVKQHRTLSGYLNLLLGLGFTLSRVEEWGPSEAQIAAHPEWGEERERPMFLLVAARR